MVEAPKINEGPLSVYSFSQRGVAPTHSTLNTLLVTPNNHPALFFILHLRLTAAARGATLLAIKPYNHTNPYFHLQQPVKHQTFTDNQ